MESLLSDIALFLLGAPQLRRGETSLLFERSKTLALLAYLAEMRRPQSREWLANLLWPESHTGRTQVRVALSELRQTALAPHIQTTRGQIALDLDAIDCDLTRFAQLCPPAKHYADLTPPDADALLNVYRGDFLTGLSVRGAPAFERWQTERAAAYRIRFESHAEATLRTHITQEQHDAALRLTLFVLATDPLNEVFCRYAMFLWSQRSQRARAIAVYDTLREGLREWGLAPEAQTRALYQHLKTPDTTDMPLPNRDTLSLPDEIRPPGALIGRERELQQMRARLRDGERLITIFGQSGVGKTHLAQTLAYQCRDQFPGRAYLIEVDSPIDGRALLGRVAGALNVEVDPLAPFNQALRASLAQAPVLLMIDNVRLVDDAPAIIHLLLSLTEQLSLILTADAPLHLKEEHRLPLGGLPIPETTGGELIPEGAVRLFLQTAQRVAPDFELSADNFDVVAQICRRVDGLPVAVILAAAWADTLSAAEILREIEASYEFLEAAYVDIPHRHRSIVSLFDRLWARLNEREHSALRALTVFRGGFSRNAAAQVGGLSHHTIRNLVDKHLLVRSTQDPTRYHLPNLLRQYAQRKLDTHGGAGTLRQRHADTFVERLVQLEPALKGGQQQRAGLELAGEIDNITVAWRYLIDIGDFDTLDTLIEPLRLYLQASGQWSQGVALFDEARAALSPEPGRLYWRVCTRLYTVDESTGAILAAAHRFAKSEGDRFEIGHTASELGWYALSHADYRGGLHNFEIAQTHWNPYPYYNALLSKGIAFCAIGVGEHQTASHHVQEALRLRRLIGDTVGEYEMRVVAGELELIAGDLTSAARLLDHAATYFQNYFGHKQAHSRYLARGWVHLFSLELDACQVFATQLVTTHLPLGAIHASAYAMLGLCALLRGDHTIARHQLERLQSIFQPSWVWSSTLNLDNAFFVQLCCALVAYHLDEQDLFQQMIHRWQTDAIKSSDRQMWVEAVCAIVSDDATLAPANPLVNHPWFYQMRQS